MNKIFQWIKKQVVSFTCNGEGKFSMTKTGANVSAVGIAIIGLPAGLNAAGASAGIEVTILLPAVVMIGAKWMIAIGAYLAIIGGRNAIDKIKSK